MHDGAKVSERVFHQQMSKNIDKGSMEVDQTSPNFIG